MTILKTDYASGNIFTVGDTTGVSGINDITNRINLHTHDGTDTQTLMSYGSGLQSPITYAVNDVDNLANISGVSISINARGKPFVAIMNGVLDGDTDASITNKMTFDIHRSGTTAGEASSFQSTFDPDSSDPTVFTTLGNNWTDNPTSGADQVVYTGRVQQPIIANQHIGSFYLTVFELT